MSKKVNEENKIVVNTNNSYLKNQLNVLKNPTGNTVEKYNKAFDYILKTMNELFLRENDYQAEIVSLENEINLLHRRLAEVEGELGKAQSKLAKLDKPAKAEKKPVKVEKKPAAKKAVKK